MNGEEFLEALARRDPSATARVIVVTGRATSEAEELALRLGAHDYLSKPYRLPLLECKIAQVLALGPPTPSPALPVTGVPALSADGKRAHKLLTGRQLSVLLRIAAGETTKEIAFDMAINDRTVRAHRSEGLRRMNMASDAEWTRYAVCAGLVGADGKPTDSEG